MAAGRWRGWNDMAELQGENRKTTDSGRKRGRWMWETRRKRHMGDIWVTSLIGQPDRQSDADVRSSLPHLTCQLNMATLPWIFQRINEASKIHPATTQLCHYCVSFLSFSCHFSVDRIIFVSISCHFRVIFVSFFHLFSVLIVSFSCHFGVIFVSFLCHFCVSLVSFLCHFCVIFVSFFICSVSW